MAKRFTRNITNTTLTGDNKEPLSTNVQNDLLSDGENVAVRNGNEYHILTDNIKEITSSDLTITKTGKNSINISGTGETSSTVFPYLSISINDNILQGLTYWTEKVPRETIFLIIETNSKEIEIELDDTGEENYFDFFHEIDSDFLQSLEQVNFQVFIKYRVKNEVKSIGNFTIYKEPETPTPEKNFNVVSGNNAITVDRNEDTFTISGKEVGVTSGNNLIEVTETEGVFTVKGKEVSLDSSDESVVIESTGLNSFDLKAVYPETPDNPTTEITSNNTNTLTVSKTAENKFMLNAKQPHITSSNNDILTVETTGESNRFNINPEEVTLSSTDEEVLNVSGSHKEGFTLGVKETEITSNNTNTLTVDKTGKNSFTLNAKQVEIVSSDLSTLTVNTDVGTNKIYLQALKQSGGFVPNQFSKYPITVFWNEGRNASNVLTVKIHIFGIPVTMNNKGVNLFIPTVGNKTHSSFTPSFSYFAAQYVNEASLNLGTDGTTYNFFRNITMLPISIKASGSEEHIHLMALKTTAIEV